MSRIHPQPAGAETGDDVLVVVVDSRTAGGLVRARLSSARAGRPGCLSGALTSARPRRIGWGVLPGRRHEERHQRQRHGEDHPPVGTAPSHRGAIPRWCRSLHQPRAHHTHGPHLLHRALRRTGAAGPGPGGRRALGDRVRSVRPARPSNSPGRGGRRGPGPRRFASPPGAGRSAAAPIPRGRSRCGTNPSAGSSGPSGTDRPPTSLDRKSWRRRRQRMAERRSSAA